MKTAECTCFHKSFENFGILQCCIMMLQSVKVITFRRLSAQLHMHHYRMTDKELQRLDLADYCNLPIWSFSVVCVLFFYEMQPDI